MPPYRHKASTRRPKLRLTSLAATSPALAPTAAKILTRGGRAEWAHDWVSDPEARSWHCPVRASSSTASVGAEIKLRNRWDVLA